MKVRILMLFVAIMLLPTLVLAEGWYAKQNKKSELGRSPFSIAEIPMLDNVNFKFNKSLVQPKYVSILDQAYGAIQTDPHLRISIQGYTDSIGSQAYNMGLSHKRAVSVQDYFNDRGVSNFRLEVAWHGEASPMASNSTSAGRAENRRCTLTLFKRDSVKDALEDLGLTE